MTHIIVDLEATCCDRGTVPRHEMEIIEIGAVALQGNGPGILDEFQSFVKPLRNPELTDFCTQLTSISQSRVDKAPPFSEVLDRFSAWINEFENPVFCSWGNYDKSQLQQDCDFHGREFPFDDRHINIKQVFADRMNLKKGVGLGRALKLVNLEFEGTAHRGIDDAKNMASLTPWIFRE